MSKKILFLIMLVCLVIGCSSQETLEDDLIEYIRSEKKSIKRKVF